MSDRHWHGTRASGKTLEQRIHEATIAPPIQCPVCGEWDNDWPNRETLCLNCYCAAFCIISDAAPPDDKPTLATIENTIRKIVHSKHRFEQMAEQIKAYRRKTGTLRRTHDRRGLRTTGD